MVMMPNQQKALEQRGKADPPAPPSASRDAGSLFYSAGALGDDLRATGPEIDEVLSSLPPGEREKAASVIRRVIRRSTDEVLHRTERRLRLAQEVGSIGCFEIDMRDGSSVGTPAFFAIYGLPETQGCWAQQEWMKFVHPDDRLRVSEQLREIARGADLAQLEYRIVRADGEVRWTASRARIETEADGRQVRAYGIQQDITELKRAEAALAAREEMLRLALEAVGDAAWDWNLQQSRIVISGKHVRTLGYGSTNFDGSLQSFTNIVHPEDVAGVAKALRRHLAGRTRRYQAEFRVRSRKGEWRSIVARGRVIERDPITGWATRMVGTSVDLGRLRPDLTP